MLAYINFLDIFVRFCKGPGITSSQKWGIVIKQVRRITKNIVLPSLINCKLQIN